MHDKHVNIGAQKPDLLNDFKNGCSEQKSDFLERSGVSLARIPLENLFDRSPIPVLFRTIVVRAPFPSVRCVGDTVLSEDHTCPRVSFPRSSSIIQVTRQRGSIRLRATVSRNGPWSLKMKKSWSLSAVVSERTSREAIDDAASRRACLSGRFLTGAHFHLIVWSMLVSISVLIGNMKVGFCGAPSEFEVHVKHVMMTPTVQLIRNYQWASAVFNHISRWNWNAVTSFRIVQTEIKKATEKIG